MSYRCTKCGAYVEYDLKQPLVRCPHCWCRILVKERPPVIRRVKAE